MTQAHDLLTDRKELEHQLKLQQMTPEVAEYAKRIWAMSEGQEDG
jgi:hypothetical protein